MKVKIAKICERLQPIKSKRDFYLVTCCTVIGAAIGSFITGVFT